MGLFFWISGWGSAGSLSRGIKKYYSGEESRQETLRKSTWSPWYCSFVKSKTQRILFPALIYTLVIDPAIVVVLEWYWHQQIGGWGEVYLTVTRYWSATRGLRGPVWYLGVLMVFDLCSVAIYSWFALSSGKGQARTTPNERRRPSFVLKWSHVATIWALVVIGSFLLKVKWPLGAQIPLTGGLVSFSMQYLMAYIMGHLAFLASSMELLTPFNMLGRHLTIALSDDQKTPSKEDPLAQTPLDPDQSPTTITPRHAIFLTYVTLPILPLLSMHPLAHYIALSIGNSLNLPSFLYSLWNEICFSIVGPALISHFSRHYASQNSKFWRLNARYAYAAFLVHAAVNLMVEFAFEGLVCRLDRSPGIRGKKGKMGQDVWMVAGPVVMTALVGTVNVFAAFGVGWGLVEYVPGIGKIV